MTFPISALTRFGALTSFNISDEPVSKAQALRSRITQLNADSQGVVREFSADEYQGLRATPDQTVKVVSGNNPTNDWNPNDEKVFALASELGITATQVAEYTAGTANYRHYSP